MKDETNRTLYLFSSDTPLLTSKGVSFDNIKDIYNRWDEPWRFYHTKKHLFDILSKIDEISDLDKKELDILKVSAIFHDAVYLPWNLTPGSNEDESYKLFESYCISADKDFKEAVKKVIDGTKSRALPEDKLAKIFWNIDNSIIYNSTFSQMLEWEEAIFKEFQFAPYSMYRENRIKFLNSINVVVGDTHTSQKIDNLIDYVKTRKIKIGIYAGSFNPFHIGHLNIIEKAEKIFDKVVIVQAVNPLKNKSVSDIMKVVRICNRERAILDKGELIVDFIDKQEIENCEVYLIRGLRNGADLSYEENQNFINAQLKPGLRTVYLHCDKEYENISSSLIRSLIDINDERSNLIVKDMLV